MVALGLVFLPSPPADAQPTQDWTRTETRDDCADYDPLRQPFFGETHTHSSYSMDALFVRNRTDPRDTYVFTKGGTLDLPPYDAMGNPLRTGQLRRPLDFAAVTDHAEGFGEAAHCVTPGLEGYTHPLCVGLRNILESEFVAAPENLPQEFVDILFPLSVVAPSHLPYCGPNDEYCLREASLIWQDTQDAADEHYDRSDACNFTTFNAYEWTYQPNQTNVHRNVIFRNDIVPPMPISAIDANSPIKLWDALEEQCEEDAPGCEFLTIPHNANVSKELIFTTDQYDGTPWTKEAAERRSRVEPLVEMIQHKGESECRFDVGGATDEECRFEKIQRSSLFTGFDSRPQPRLSFIRNGVKEGLRIESEVGANPFRLGFIGATDGHSSAAGAVNEQDHKDIGHQGVLDSIADSQVTPFAPSGIQTNPGGLAVLWAEENSRDALFAAMQRREAYATSGPRPIVRVFGGRMPEGLCENPDFVEEGYENGVPMGGEIGPVNGKKSPTFAILAQKDTEPDAAPLQQIQVIKGWVDKNGRAQEKVYTVAGDPKNGAGVDVSTCEREGDGFDSLCTVWSDPKFKPEQHAFYYVRVLENPTCRWSTYICNENGVDCANDVIPEGFEQCCNNFYFPQTIQERAWTSPIWYTPISLGIGKSRVSFSETSLGRIQSKALLGLAPSDFDPSLNDITLELGPETPAWTALVPAGTMEVKKPGRKWILVDREGSVDGLRKFILVVSKKGTAKIKIDARDVDVSGIPAADGKLTLRFASGDFDSSDTIDWALDDDRLNAITK